MKRIISMLLISILLLSASRGYAEEISSLTDEQINQLYDIVRNEIARRGLVAENKVVIYDSDNIQLYINGDVFIEKPSFTKEIKLIIPVIIINNSDKSIEFLIQDSSVNGWAVEGYLLDGVPARKKAKSEIYFYVEDIEIESIDDFEDAEFILDIRDKEHPFTTMLSTLIKVFSK